MKRHEYNVKKEVWIMQKNAIINQNKCKMEVQHLPHDEDVACPHAIDYYSLGNPKFTLIQLYARCPQSVSVQNPKYLSIFAHGSISSNSFHYSLTLQNILLDQTNGKLNFNPIHHVPFHLRELMYKLEQASVVQNKG